MRFHCLYFIEFIRLVSQSPIIPGCLAQELNEQTVNNNNWVPGYHYRLAAAATSKNSVNEFSVTELVIETIGRNNKVLWKLLSHSKRRHIQEGASELS